MPDLHSPNLLTVEDLAEVLKVHPGTVYAMVRDGRVPAIRGGRRYLFDLQQVLAALATEVPST